MNNFNDLKQKPQGSPTGNEYNPLCPFNLKPISPLQFLNIETNRNYKVLNNWSKDPNQESTAASTVPFFLENNHFSNISLPKPIITNVISISKVNLELNLRKIALLRKDVEYNIHRAKSFAVMHMKNSNIKVKIYGTGTLICVGAKTVDDSRNASRECTKLIQLCYGYENLKWGNFKVNEIVAQCDFKFWINLSELTSYIDNHKDKDLFEQDKQKIIKGKSNINYETEIFPRIHFYSSTHKITLMIFKTGKVIFFKAKEIEPINKIITDIYPILSKFKSEKSNATNNKKKMFIIRK
jgi:TATA-box binding protein (TBP) (component of TFIID and TFIIIB)